MGGKKKPIPFSTAMVQAILNGSKTQTRRIIKHYGKTPADYKRHLFYKLVDELNGKNGLWAGFYKDSDVFEHEGEQMIDAIYFKCPYQPGDILWVRETWKAVAIDSMRYQIDIEFKDGKVKRTQFTRERWEKFRKFKFKNGWQSPYFMPYEAARLILRAKSIRVERLQDIGYGDAVYEGTSTQRALEIGSENFTPTFNDPDGENIFPCYREAFAELWDSINAKRGYGWGKNPWVWVIEFDLDLALMTGRLETDEVHSLP